MNRIDQMLARMLRKKNWKVDRIASKSVTETLARAMEHADQMKTVVVLYDTPDDCEVPGGLFLQDDTSFSSVNWLLDQAKKWVIE